jgi:hypothetical protein
MHPHTDGVSVPYWETATGCVPPADGFDFGCIGCLGPRLPGLGSTQTSSGDIATIHDLPSPNLARQRDESGAGALDRQIGREVHCCHILTMYRRAGGSAEASISAAVLSPERSPFLPPAVHPSSYDNRGMHVTQPTPTSCGAIKES